MLALKRMAEVGPLLHLTSCSVYTPEPLAEAMVNAIMDSYGAWLDPCVGAGAFTAALAAAGVPPCRVTALDLDRKPQAADAYASVLRGTDFIAWADDYDGRFDRIVANPPFIAIGRLAANLRDRATGVKFGENHPVSKGANYWCAFLCQSLRLLSAGGAIAFLLPASWEYANYAAHIRKELPVRFESFEVHRSVSPLFSSVQEGSIVIVGKGFQRPHRSQRYLEYRDIAHLVAGLQTTVSAETDSAVRIRSLSQRSNMQSEVPLKHVMSIGIGAVTGDARYFLMTESRRRDLGLPLGSVRPIVTRARDLSAPFIDEAGWTRLRDANSRVWLFSPPPALVGQPAVSEYLALTDAAGGCNRSAGKVLDRDPWFRTPLATSPEGFMSGMSRLGPWICLRRKHNLSASNTLYVIRFRKRLPMDMRAAWSLSLLTSTARAQLVPAGRRYPDGLLKYEPRDLEDILLPKPQHGSGAVDAYTGAVKALIAASPEAATEIADKWFASMASKRPVTHRARALACPNRSAR